MSVSIAGLDRAPGRPWSGPDGARAAIRWTTGLGVRYIQLDATHPDLRPRDLNRSARRDLAALLRRAELACSGLDLWIPPEHFLSPATVDRALSAALGAIELAADLATLTGGGSANLSLVLPDDAPAEVLAQLESAAEATGVRVADHAAKAVGDGGRRSGAPGPLGIGIDPAAILLAGQDPVVAAARAGAAIAAARLSDASSIGRVAPRTSGGRMDETAYLATLVTAGHEAPLILDLRGLPEQDAAARTVAARWNENG